MTENKKCCGKSLPVREKQSAFWEQKKKKNEIDKRAERERYCRKQGEEKDMVNGEKGSKCER